MGGRGISTHHHCPGESPILWAEGEAQTELKESSLGEKTEAPSL